MLLNIISPRQNFTGQNVTGQNVSGQNVTKIHSNKCHKMSKEPPDQLLPGNTSIEAQGDDLT